jgi:hypothetical protein
LLLLARAAVSYSKPFRSSIFLTISQLLASSFQKDETFIHNIARDRLLGLIHAAVEDYFIYKLQPVDE